MSLTVIEWLASKCIAVTATLTAFELVSPYKKVFFWRIYYMNYYCRPSYIYPAENPLWRRRRRCTSSSLSSPCSSLYQKGDVGQSADRPTDRSQLSHYIRMSSWLYESEKIGLLFRLNRGFLLSTLSLPPPKTTFPPPLPPPPCPAAAAARVGGTHFRTFKGERRQRDSFPDFIGTLSTYATWIMYTCAVRSKQQVSFFSLSIIGNE